MCKSRVTLEKKKCLEDSVQFWWVPTPGVLVIYPHEVMYSYHSPLTYSDFV